MLLAHDTAGPQVPSSWHDCTAAPEHCVVPGEQAPPQAPFEQAIGHGTPEPHCPLSLQVWRLVPEHFVAPGLQTPTQPPPMHAWPEQGIGVPGWPVESHSTTDPFKHCVVVGGQTNPPSASAFTVASEASSDVPSGPSAATVVSCAASWPASSPASSTTMLAS
jgi:hypothetical protein